MTLQTRRLKEAGEDYQHWDGNKWKRYFIRKTKNKTKTCGYILRTQSSRKVKVTQLEFRPTPTWRAYVMRTYWTYMASSPSHVTVVVVKQFRISVLMAGKKAYSLSRVQIDSEPGVRFPGSCLSFSHTAVNTYVLLWDVMDEEGIWKTEAC